MYRMFWGRRLRFQCSWTPSTDPNKTNNRFKRLDVRMTRRSSRRATRKLLRNTVTGRKMLATVKLIHCWCCILNTKRGTCQFFKMLVVLHLEFKFLLLSLCIQGLCPFLPVLRLLPTFRGRKNRLFFYLTKILYRFEFFVKFCDIFTSLHNLIKTSFGCNE